jgi:hypothetical protein
MNDAILAAIESVFAELDAETTETDYPTDEIVAAMQRRANAVDEQARPMGLTMVSLTSALLTTFYAGALWRERALLGSGMGDDMRETLLAAARSYIASKGGVKRAEAVAILTEFFNADENVIATEDEIEDEAGRPLYVGVRVCEHPESHQGDEPLGHGKIVSINSSGDNDGQAPSIEVQWDGQDAVGPETIDTNVRDYAKEGPSGPYVYVAEEIRVV